MPYATLGVTCKANVLALTSNEKYIPPSSDVYLKKPSEHIVKYSFRNVPFFDYPEYIKDTQLRCEGCNGGK